MNAAPATPRATGALDQGLGTHAFHRNFNPAWGLAIGYDDLKAIEPSRFLESFASGVQGSPGFREAVAVARVQEATTRSRGSERWEPMTYEE